jgi:4-diphosphocytidyl-2-C-methyl-D-erythritol kinase
MHLISPAKINLHLRVGPRAPGGFHPLLSWMCTINFCDTIRITPTATDQLHLTCNNPDVPTDKSNLILRAAVALGPKTGADIHLGKRIPIGGGMGGGSSNAAAALLGFNQLWNLNLTPDELSPIAATLGSDVPFFLHGPSSICQGRGERVTPIPAPAPKFAVLFFPDLSMSTPAVYRKFDELNLGSDRDIHNHFDWTQWSRLPAAELLKKLINDLESPAFSLCPQLAKLREQIEDQISQTVRMSGSGSTLFTLADDQSYANQILAQTKMAPIRTQAFALAPPVLLGNPGELKAGI